MKRTVGKAMRSIRKGKGWSMNEASKRAGIASSALSYAERDERQLSLGSLWALADAYGVSLDALVGRDTSGKESPAQKKLDAIRRLLES